MSHIIALIARMEPDEEAQELDDRHWTGDVGR